MEYADMVTKITKHRFGVDSKSDPTRHHMVQRVPQSNIWYCGCKYFHHHIARSNGKKRYCYHIKTCVRYREEEFAKKNIERFDNLTYFCPKYSSTTFTKAY